MTELVDISPTEASPMNRPIVRTVRNLAAAIAIVVLAAALTFWLVS